MLCTSVSVWFVFVLVKFAFCVKNENPPARKKLRQLDEEDTPGETQPMWDLPACNPTRYIVWGNLLNRVRNAAKKDPLSYNKETWNTEGMNDIELDSWFTLGEAGQSIAGELGYDEESYDCWVNHYVDYDWDEFVMLNMTDPFETLGWNRTNWDNVNATPPVSETKPWGALTNVEKGAARTICYFRDSWNGLSLANYRWTC